LDDKPPCGAVNDAMVVLAAWAQLPNDPDLRFLISDIIRFHLMFALAATISLNFL
jgi:hypothetical protein